MSKDISTHVARPLADGLSLSLASADEIRAIASHAEALRGADYQDRVRKGDVCYLLKANGEIVSYNWIRFDRCCVFCSYQWEIGFLPLNERQAFTYDFYTYRKHRRAGYGSLLKQHMLSDLRERGIQEVFSIVYRHNYDSLRIHLRLHYDVRYLFNGYQLLSWTRYRLIPKSRLRGLPVWVDHFCRHYGLLEDQGHE